MLFFFEVFQLRFDFVESIVIFGFSLKFLIEVLNMLGKYCLLGVTRFHFERDGKGRVEAH
jgi:hypothetical protein